MVLEIGADELVLAAKDAVQRRLGNAGPFDDATGLAGMVGARRSSRAW
jgi:hypothetical protein